MLRGQPGLEDACDQDREEGDEHPAEEAFHRLARGDLGRERPATECPSAEVRGRIAEERPDQDIDQDRPPVGELAQQLGVREPEPDPVDPEQRARDRHARVHALTPHHHEREHRRNGGDNRQQNLDLAPETRREHHRRERREAGE